MHVRTRKRKLATAALLSVLVGTWVGLTTRWQTLSVCPRSVPADALRVTDVRIDHLYAEVGGCSLLVPLLPTYVGLGILLLTAVWIRGDAN